MYLPSVCSNCSPNFVLVDLEPVDGTDGNVGEQEKSRSFDFSVLSDFSRVSVGVIDGASHNTHVCTMILD